MELLADVAAKLKEFCRQKNAVRSAIYWLPGRQPRALLLRAHGEKATVGLLQWPVYPPHRGEDKPRPVFIADLEKIRDPYKEVVEGLAEVVMDDEAPTVNTFFLPHDVREARKAWRGYEIPAEFQIAHCFVPVGDIIVA